LFNISPRGRAIVSAIAGVPPHGREARPCAAAPDKPLKAHSAFFQACHAMVE